MESIFKNVPLDKDARILFQAEVRLGSCPVLYQKWRRDSIEAESIIFAAHDVAKLSDAELEAEVRSSPLVQGESKVTISRSDTGFVFTNFNFRQVDD